MANNISSPDMLFFYEFKTFICIIPNDRKRNYHQNNLGNEHGVYYRIDCSNN